MNVYEVEIVTDAPGFRLVQHVRAVDEVEALQKAQNRQGAQAVLRPEVTLRRACRDREIADELAQPLMMDLPVRLAAAEIVP